LGTGEVRRRLIKREKKRNWVHQNVGVGDEVEGDMTRRNGLEVHIQGVNNCIELLERQIRCKERKEPNLGKEEKIGEYHRNTQIGAQDRWGLYD